MPSELEMREVEDALEQAARERDALKLNVQQLEEFIGWRDARRISIALERDVLKAENERLREENGILEDALQEVGDDYPGSYCQKWCVQQIKRARDALAAQEP